jgi:hypothetical protein
MYVLESKLDNIADKQVIAMYGSTPRPDWRWDDTLGFGAEFESWSSYQLKRLVTPPPVVGTTFRERRPSTDNSRTT